MSKNDYILILRALATDLHERELKAKTDEERNDLWLMRKFCNTEYERVCGIIPDFENTYPVGFVLLVLMQWAKMPH